MSAIEAVIVRVLQSVSLGRVAVRLSGDLRRRLYHCGMAVAGQSIPYLPVQQIIVRQMEFWTLLAFTLTEGHWQFCFCFSSFCLSGWC